MRLKVGDEMEVLVGECGKRRPESSGDLRSQQLRESLSQEIGASVAKSRSGRKREDGNKGWLFLVSTATQIRTRA